MIRANMWSITAFITMMALTISAASALRGGAVVEQEMQRAAYFTFVTLVNMVPNNRIPINTTFLMPRDHMLSNVSVIHEGNVTEFILMHSIPSRLLMEDLIRLPSGTLIPTNKPGFMLRVYNRGRKRFYLNSILVNSPNICSAGNSSFRCHGIDGVLKTKKAKTTALSNCLRASPPTAAPAPSPLSPMPVLVDPSNMDPSLASPPTDELNVGSRTSSSSELSSRGSFWIIMLCLMILGLLV